MIDLDISLEDKYRQESGQVYMSGTQALVRLMMLQAQADKRAGLNTAGFVSGYRGSPLGALDFEFWRARKHLDAHDIVFESGLNEDLAATAVWGTQQAGLFPGARFDGVFGLWYGKGPGVDRSGDVFKHANFAGTAPHGGVLALAGDDHAAKSTSTASQAEYSFVDAMMPVVVPSNAQEFLDFGLYGYALSRFTGLWVGFKVTATNVDTSGTVTIDPGRGPFNMPNFEMPADGVHIRLPDDRIPQEVRLRHFKMPAVEAFLRANPIDRIEADSPNARLGIVTAGKSWLDVSQALDELGIDADAAARMGLRIYKLGLTWPIEPEGLVRFADGLEEILVVEEKRGFIEDQIKTILYDRGPASRPRVIGKTDGEGRPLIPDTLDFNADLVARAIGERLGRFVEDADLAARTKEAAGRAQRDKAPPLLARTPYFCSGCPHNTSTVVPEGSKALAGIGCHSLAMYQGRAEVFTHMGGEGASWIGIAPFTEMPHVFQNMGDGTYYHSGILGIRACVAAKTNITFKLLYNDAVAMTGGQPVEGQPTVPQITHQIAAEGVKKIVVVTDDIYKYDLRDPFAADVTIRHRDDLDQVQRELRDIEGVTVLVYDQTCAAEKRRRRKRGTFPDPARRVMINDLVCEGCGDCAKVANCVSVVPIETEFGRKRAIDQSSCNKDYSCLKGFCPSFVTVEGGKLKKRAAIGDDIDPATLPAVALPPLDEPHRILITGVGGTGVVTIGQILGMAAHLEGKGSAVADVTGLSQKGGPVLSQVTVARSADAIHTAQIGAAEADALIACDIVTASMPDGLARLAEGRTRAVVNLQETQTGAFTQNPDMAFPGGAMRERIEGRIDRDHADFLQASRIALSLVGDTIGTNMFMAGFAWQRGMIPLSCEAIERAIELNGAQVKANLKAFRWGRRAAHEPEAVEALLADDPVAAFTPRPKTLDELIAHRSRLLVDYQNRKYADRYKALVDKVHAAEKDRTPGHHDLTDAVARYFYKLMAYKDEYEVARLYTDTAFLARVRGQFEGDIKVKFHLAPPAFAPRDPVSGLLQKREFGPWMLPAFRVLKRLRFLRGTFFDPFGHSGERKGERRLIRDYEALMDEVCAKLSPENRELAVALASVPEKIRGYGHIKERHLAEAKAEEAKLLAAFRAPGAAPMAAE